MVKHLIRDSCCCILNQIKTLKLLKEDCKKGHNNLF